jgi:hypothetical protein
MVQILALLAVTASHAWGQADRSRTATATNPPAVGIVLTGIVEVPGTAVKRAFLETGEGSGARCHSLCEGQRSGDVQVLKIDGGKTVTVSYRGEILELAFVAPSQRGDALRNPEREKDISHAQHHAERARLDRERDRLERRRSN